jgi:orotate phosphoribosyltransferase
MTSKGDYGQKVAEFLLQIKAIELSPERPFELSNGLKSPVTCDNRKIPSYPKVRTFIRQQFVKSILEHYGKPDAIAGVATGGIAHGALVAEEMGLPFVYVRSAPKSKGPANLVEGVFQPGASVVVVEDLVSTGKSSLQAVAALRQKGAVVKGMVAIFTYGLPIAEKEFKKAACELQTLSNYNVILEQAKKSEYISQGQIEQLELWKRDPEEWSRNFKIELN